MTAVKPARFCSSGLQVLLFVLRIHKVNQHHVTMELTDSEDVINMLCAPLCPPQSKELGGRAPGPPTSITPARSCHGGNHS